MRHLQPFRFGAIAILSLAALQFGITPDAFGQRQRFQPQSQTPEEDMEEVKEKFVELLGEKDLSHFRGYQDATIGSGWSIDGKHLVFDGSGKGDIMTNNTYEDFELQLEWKVSEGGNSGIMFRVTTGDAQPYMSGPEFQILDDTTHADGKSELTSAGSLYGMYPAEGKKLRAVGSWNKSRIVSKGNSITHYLNGTKVVEAKIGDAEWNEKLAESKFKDWEKFAQATTGHICLQNHGDPVRFRNIRIKKLSSGGVASSKPRTRQRIGAPTGVGGYAGNAGAAKFGNNQNQSGGGAAASGGARRGPAGQPPGMNRDRGGQGRQQGGNRKNDNKGGK